MDERTGGEVSGESELGTGREGSGDEAVRNGDGEAGRDKDTASGGHRLQPLPKGPTRGLLGHLLTSETLSCSARATLAPASLENREENMQGKLTRTSRSLLRALPL